MTDHGRLAPSICCPLHASSVLMPICWGLADYQPAFCQHPCKSNCQFWNLFVEEWGWVVKTWHPWARLGRVGVSQSTGGCHAIQAGWVGLQRRRRQWNQRLVQSSSNYVCGSFHLWGATPGTDHRGRTGLTVQRGSLSRPRTPGEQESALQAPCRTGHESSSCTHTCSGESDGAPPWAPTRPERLPEEDLAEHLDTQNKAGSSRWGGRAGSSLSTLEACVARDGRAPVSDGHSWEYPLWEWRWGRLGQLLRPLIWRPSRQGNFNRIKVSSAK